MASSLNIAIKKLNPLNNKQQWRQGVGIKPLDKNIGENVEQVVQHSKVVQQVREQVVQHSTNVVEQVIQHSADSITKGSLTSSATEIRFENFSKLNKKILFYISESCKKNLTNITEGIKAKNLATFCQASEGTIQTSILRLQKSGFIKRVEYKTGNHGWTKYSLEPVIYSQIINYKFGPEFNVSSTNVVEQVVQHSADSITKSSLTSSLTPLYSSSSNNNKTTTTENTEELSYKLQDWIEFYKLENMVELNVLLDSWKKLDPAKKTTFEESAEHLLFYLSIEKNREGIKNMGSFVYSKLIKGYYPAPSGFIPWQVRQEEDRARDLQNKKEQLEKIKTENLKKEGEIWAMNLTDEERQQHLKDFTYGGGEMAKKNHLQMKFLKFKGLI